MKKFIFLIIIIFSFNSFAQDVAVENIDHNQILYRGFQNKLVITPANENIQLDPINCQISKLEGQENTYIVLTKSKSRTATINFVSDGKVLETRSFLIQNLPVPELYWGDQKSGSTTSNTSEIQLKYPKGVTLKSNFEIVNWQASINGKQYEGKGSTLTKELIDSLSTLDKGEIIQITTHVKNKDGITKLMKGTWKVT